ncbi:methyl-accepting chemotaxis protein [Acidovorax kalamii]|uniref:methyl-accepting chemotaxis protein n=1 Tax=Acidovorax kalamii TaxID=2004485 RepID=UPI002090DF03|nr:methyl-accepting chemotaxis protein [Acidovorax kalamii]MCO5356198.1 methyl-accepting chemotaxis protein [Acidovorax kalamii]
MNFNDLKISTRLTLGFGLMGLLIGIMGTLSMGLSHRADNAFHSIIDDRFPKVLNLHVAKEDVTAVELALTQMLLDTRPENLQRHQALVNSKRQEITQLLDTLGQQITSPEGKAALAETQRARSDYAAQLQRYSELANAGQLDEARTILTGAMAAPRATYFEALDRLIAYQESLAKNAQAEAVAAVSTMNVFVLSLTGLSLIAGAVIGLRIVRSTTEPLRRAVDAARAVAAGDLSLPITYRGTNETAQLLKALLEMQQSLVHLVGQVRHNSDSVSNASAEIAQGNNDLSARTEQQASALQETAASMEQLNTAVRNNADNAQRADAMARSASEVAAQGGSVVAEVVHTMKDINESSRQIADIVGVIDSIAFQTNILALNAAVEAARAGEQGRGFAVVATEVRVLASRSAEASREIKSLIGTSVERVEAGTALVDRAGQTMSEVVASIRRVTDIMGEISAASTEQSQGVDQINEAVTQMDQATQQNAALVEEMAAAAASLNHQATDLVNTVATFRLSAQDETTALPPPSRTKALAHTQHTPQAAQPRAAARPMVGKHDTPRPTLGHRPRTTTALKPAAVALATASGGDANWESF